MPKISIFHPYVQGAIWFLLHIVVGCVNDVITKHIGSHLPSVEIIFLRFTFGMLTLLPILFFRGKSAFSTTRPLLHAVRGLILFLSLAGWCYGMKFVPLTTLTIIGFTIPLFVLVLAFFFLKEKMDWQRIAAAIVGFIGVAVTLRFHHVDFDPRVFSLIGAAVLFASLDVLNKKYITQEKMVNMLFYSSLFTTLFSAIPSYLVWETPSLQEIGLCFLLGAGANILLYCLLKSFSLTDASSLAPFRYNEFIISIAFGFFFFGEIPASTTYAGAAIIIPSTFFIIYHETHRKKG